MRVESTGKGQLSGEMQVSIAPGFRETERTKNKQKCNQINPFTFHIHCGEWPHFTRVNYLAVLPVLVYLYSLSPPLCCFHWCKSVISLPRSLPYFFRHTLDCFAARTCFMSLAVAVLCVHSLESL